MMSFANRRRTQLGETLAWGERDRLTLARPGRRWPWAAATHQPGDRRQAPARGTGGSAGRQARPPALARAGASGRARRAARGRRRRCWARGVVRRVRASRRRLAVGQETRRQCRGRGAAAAVAARWQRGQQAAMTATRRACRIVPEGRVPPSCPCRSGVAVPGERGREHPGRPVTGQPGQHGQGEGCQPRMRRWSRRWQALVLDARRQSTARRTRARPGRRGRCRGRAGGAGDVLQVDELVVGGEGRRRPQPQSTAGSFRDAGRSRRRRCPGTASRR